MAKMDILDVQLYGAPIGTLTRLAGDQTVFAFNDSYIEDQNRPLLSLGFRDSYGGLLTTFRTYQTRLMPFFSNLLPEGPMRRYLAAWAGINPQREFFLLRALGADLPGAVTVQPPEGQSFLLEPDKEIADTCGPATSPLQFSLAGVQLKFSAVEKATGGLTIPVTGIGGNRIVKLPSLEHAHVPENEFAMMTLARLIGIQVPAIDLIAPEDIGNLPSGIGKLEGPALVIDRFDRLGDGTPVHFEEFAQIFRIYPENKYQKRSMSNIAEVIAIEGRDEDVIEFVRRITFTMLIGNGDMHLKNWALIYPDRRNAALAPAYDMVSTIPYIENDQAALTISKSKRFENFDNAELARLAVKAGLPQKLILDTAKETVVRFHEHWNKEKAHLPLPQKFREAIDAHVRTVPLARG